MITNEYNLIREMLDYNTKKCLFDDLSFIKDKESKLKPLMGLLSDDGFEYGKAISEWIATIRDVAEKKKVACLSEGADQKKTQPLEQAVSDATMMFSVVLEEFKQKPMKRTWAKSTTKPLITMCESNPQLWDSEQTRLLKEIDHMICNTLSGTEKDTSYDRALSQWEAADLKTH